MRRQQQKAHQRHAAPAALQAVAQRHGRLQAAHQGAADARRGKSVTAYVAAVHAASQQLVLEPFAKPRPPSLKLSELAVGTEWNCRVVGMTAKFAYVDTLASTTARGLRKLKGGCAARLVLPPTIALETAPVKSASIEKVLRLDDLVTCYVRRRNPRARRLEVGLEPASSETLASEAKARGRPPGARTPRRGYKTP